VRCRGVPPRDFLGITSLLGDLSGVYPVRQRQVLLTPKKYPPPQKTSKTTVPTHQTSATPQPSGGCQTLNFWGVGTVAKAPVWRVQSCMTKQSEERFFFGVCFFILYVPVHVFDRRTVRNRPSTPSREEAVQARLRDVRRILRRQNHQQGLWQGP